MSNFVQDFAQTLYGVFSNLMISLVIAGLALTIYFALRWFQRPVKERKGLEVLELLREMFVLAPLLWLILNWEEDPSVLANTFLGFWLPIVLVSIFALGMVEIAMMPAFGESREVVKGMRQKSSSRFRRMVKR